MELLLGSAQAGSPLITARHKNNWFSTAQGADAALGSYAAKTDA